MRVRKVQQRKRVIDSQLHRLTLSPRIQIVGHVDQVMSPISGPRESFVSNLEIACNSEVYDFSIGPDQLNSGTVVVQYGVGRETGDPERQVDCRVLDSIATDLKSIVRANARELMVSSGARIERQSNRGGGAGVGRQPLLDGK